MWQRSRVTAPSLGITGQALLSSSVSTTAPSDFGVAPAGEGGREVLLRKSNWGGRPGREKKHGKPALFLLALGSLGTERPRLPPLLPTPSQRKPPPPPPHPPQAKGKPKASPLEERKPKPQGTCETCTGTPQVPQETATGNDTPHKLPKSGTSCFSRLSFRCGLSGQFGRAV